MKRLKQLIVSYLSYRKVVYNYRNSDLSFIYLVRLPHLQYYPRFPAPILMVILPTFLLYRTMGLHITNNQNIYS